MYAIALLQGMVFYGSIATLYRQSVGVTVFQITIIESISLALTILLELPWGMIADKIGYRTTFIFCSFLYFISKIVFWRAESFGGFLLERIMISVICSGLSGVETSILYLSGKSLQRSDCTSQPYAKDEFQKVFGIYTNLGTTGLLLAAAIYSLFDGNDYRIAGFLTVISYGIAAVLSLGITEVKERKEKSHNQEKEFLLLLKQTLTNKRLILLIIAVSLVSQTHWLITVFLNQLQYSKAGMSARAISIVYIIMTLCGLLGGFSADLTAKTGDKKMGTLLIFTSGLSCVILALTCNPILSVVAVLLLRISYSLLEPLQEKQQNQAITTKDRATALSINALIMDAIAIFTNLIYGKLSDWNLSMTMLIGGLVCCFSLILFLKSQNHCIS